MAKTASDRRKEAQLNLYENWQKDNEKTPQNNNLNNNNHNCINHPDRFGSYSLNLGKTWLCKECWDKLEKNK